MDERLGCLPIFYAYCAGTYLLAPHVELTLGWHWSYVLAPIVFPLILSFGILTVGNSEVPISIEFSGFYVIVWLSLTRTGESISVATWRMLPASSPTLAASATTVFL